MKGENENLVADTTDLLSKNAQNSICTEIYTAELEIPRFKEVEVELTE